MTIKELRQQHNLTQAQYGKLAGVSTRHVQRYEHGEFEEPKSAHDLVELKLWLCDQCGIHPKELSKSYNQMSVFKSKINKNKRFRPIKSIF